jgi:hypothetical protein
MYARARRARRLSGGLGYSVAACANGKDVKASGTTNVSRPWRARTCGVQHAFNGSETG